jgi:transcription elongation factor Elf1
MWLMHIVPEEPGCDRRTFTCPVCEYSESVVAKIK